MKHGKKYVEAAKLIDRSKVYEAEEAVALVKNFRDARGSWHVISLAF